MNYTRFTIEEKKQAVCKVTDRDFILVAIERVSVVYTDQPSMIIKRPDVYAEIYNITRRDQKGSYPVLSFCRDAEDEVHCNIIRQIKENEYWVSGKISAHDKFIKQLNASIYGKYDNTHIKELVISFFFAVYSVLLHEDKVNIIRATRGGLEFFKKSEREPDRIVAVKFTPYENLDPLAFRSIYLKINKNFREIAALSAKEKYTAKDTKELEYLCDDNEVVAFFKALKLKGEL
jgi:hypothetical protein